MVEAVNSQRLPKEQPASVMLSRAWYREGTTLELAMEAADGRDIQIGGGVSTIRQYLEARLIDELHLALAPRFLGSGEHLLHGLDLPALGYECTTHVPTSVATHIIVTRHA